MLQSGSCARTYTRTLATETVRPVSGTKHDRESLRRCFARQTTILLLHTFSELPGTRIVTAKQANGACRQWTQVVVGRIVGVLLSIRTRVHIMFRFRSLVAKKEQMKQTSDPARNVSAPRGSCSRLSATRHIRTMRWTSSGILLGLFLLLADECANCLSFTIFALVHGRIM